MVYESSPPTTNFVTWEMFRFSEFSKIDFDTRKIESQAKDGDWFAFIAKLRPRRRKAHHRLETLNFEIASQLKKMLRSDWNHVAMPHKPKLRRAKMVLINACLQNI